MGRHARCCVALLALSLAFSATAANSQSEQHFSARTRLVTQDIEVTPDGLSTRTVHTETEILDPSGARATQRLPIPYNQAMEDLEIVEAYTRKPDGRKLAVDLAQIAPEPAQDATGVHLPDDQMQKTVVFPDLGVGDVAVVTARKRAKQAYFPGHYMHGVVFAPTMKTDEARVTLKVPVDFAVNVETHGMSYESARDGSANVHRWRLASPAYEHDDESVLSHWDRAPRLFVSSFTSYDALGRAYAELVIPKLAVTPAVQQLADEITAGVTDRRAQAQALYEWVSGNVGYVAQFLDKGKIHPREADAVLQDRRGDCKDHAVLYGALLKAKGIESDIVLINLGNAYSLSQTPTLSQLNHVINYLPEFSLYADTTLGVAPFGTLALEEYGKPVVHAVAQGPALRSTPVVPEGAISIAIKTTQRLADDGRILGNTTTSATGPLLVQLRQMARSIEQAGTRRAAQNEIVNAGLRGTGRFDIPPGDEIDGDYSITGFYDLRARPRLLEGEAFAPPPGLWLVTRPGGILMGLLRLGALRDTESTPCFTGRAVEQVTLEIPSGRRIVALPAGARISGAHFDYVSRWSLEGQTLTVQREFTTHVDQPLCSGATRKEAAAALAAIRQDHQTPIRIVPADAASP